MSRWATVLAALWLVAYTLIVVGRNPAAGTAVTIVLAVLPVLGSACTLLVLWIARADQVGLALAAFGESVGWVAAGWDITLSALYALGLCCGALPGALLWAACSRREPQTDDAHRSWPTRAGLITVAVATASIAVVFSAVPTMAVLLVPTPVLLATGLVVVKRGGVDRRLPPVVLSAGAVAVVLTICVVGVEAVRVLSAGERAWLAALAVTTAIGAGAPGLRKAIGRT